MNVRRSRYTCFGVISELRILAMEVHLGVHAHFDRPAIFLRRAESPLLEGAHGHVVGIGAKRLQNPDDPRRAVLEQHDIEDHGAGARRREAERRFTTLTACGGVTPGPTSDTMSLAICALMASLRSVNPISISTSIGTATPLRVPGRKRHWRSATSAF